MGIDEKEEKEVKFLGSRQDFTTRSKRKREMRDGVD